MIEDSTKDNKRFISEFKFSNEEIKVMKELFDKLEEVSEVCQKLKLLCSEHDEINKTCQMWTDMTKSFEEILDDSIFLDKADTKTIN